MKVLSLAVTGLALAGCFGGGAGTRGGLSGERTAALARLVVDNRTELRLEIAFRYAVEPGGEVGVGAVAPGSRVEVAPIPAAEPIILIARAGTFERRLDPRSFEVDELWVWVVRSEDADE